MAYVDSRNIDTIVVTSHNEDFKSIFIEKNCWKPVAIATRIMPKIKYFAIYRTTPISAITHYAEIEYMTPCRNLYHKYIIQFKKNSIKKLNEPIGKKDGKPGGPAGVLYTNIELLLSATTLKELSKY